MKTLLAAIDFSKNTAPVLEQASKLAKALEAKLWVLHVANDENKTITFSPYLGADFTADMPPMADFVHLSRELCAEELKREHSALLSIAKNLRRLGVDAHALLMQGKAPDLILKKATALEADIILLGSHGHGLLHKAILGSISGSVLRHATCNVMIVPAIGN